MHNFLAVHQEHDPSDDVTSHRHKCCNSGALDEESRETRGGGSLGRGVAAVEEGNGGTRGFHASEKRAGDIRS